MNPSRRSFMKNAVAVSGAVAVAGFSPIVPARVMQIPSECGALVPAKPQKWDCVNEWIQEKGALLFHGFNVGGYVLEFFQGSLPYVDTHGHGAAWLHRDRDTFKFFINGLIFAELPMNGDYRVTAYYEILPGKLRVTTFDLTGPAHT